MHPLSTESLYQKYESKLNGRESRKVGNNTYLKMLDRGCIGVLFHNTYVVKVWDDGRVQYNTGGWETVTTKARINQYGRDDARVWPDRGTWKVYIGEVKVPFENGMILVDEIVDDERIVRVFASNQMELARVMIERNWTLNRLKEC
jgi:hypothetical protein